MYLSRESQPRWGWEEGLIVGRTSLHSFAGIFNLENVSVGAGIVSDGRFEGKHGCSSTNLKTGFKDNVSIDIETSQKCGTTYPTELCRNQMPWPRIIGFEIEIEAILFAQRHRMQSGGREMLLKMRLRFCFGVDIGGSICWFQRSFVRVAAYLACLWRYVGRLELELPGSRAGERRNVMAGARYVHYAVAQAWLELLDKLKIT